MVVYQCPSGLRQNSHCIHWPAKCPLALLEGTSCSTDIYTAWAFTRSPYCAACTTPSGNAAVTYPPRSFLSRSTRYSVTWRFITRSNTCLRSYPASFHFPPIKPAE
jgi:hypothetical protein